VRARAFIVALPAMALCATMGRLASEEPSGQQLPKGTRAIAFSLSKGQELPKGSVPGAEVDIVCEISEPVETGIAILKVELLAVDGRRVGSKEPQAVTVLLTPVQEEVLALMQKHGTKLGIKAREKGKN
jgi:hypothetical protein